MESKIFMEGDVSSAALSTVVTSDELYALLHKKESISQLSLEDYEKIIKFCSVVDESILIQNDTEKHATIMFKYFFDVVKENVFIYADTFGGKLGNDRVFIEIFEKFFEEKKEILTTVIYRSEPENNGVNQILRRNFLKNPQRIDLFQVKNDVISSSLPKNFFSTFDKTRFRLVLDEQTSNAVCNFYEPYYTKNFNDEFLDLLKGQNIQRLS